MKKIALFVIGYGIITSGFFAVASENIARARKKIVDLVHEKETMFRDLAATRGTEHYFAAERACDVATSLALLVMVNKYTERIYDESNKNFARCLLSASVVWFVRSLAIASYDVLNYLEVRASASDINERIAFLERHIAELENTHVVTYQADSKDEV